MDKKLVKSPQAEVIRQSYSYNVLERIRVNENVVTQMERHIKKTKEKLENILNDIKPETDIKIDIENREARIKLIEEQVKCQRERLKVKKQSIEYNDASINAKINELSQKRKQYENDLIILDETKGKIENESKHLQQIEKMLSLRYDLMISDLLMIFPIRRVATSDYTICGIVLPDSEKFKGHPNLRLSTAIGYVCHFLIVLSNIADIPLRYKLIFYGSRSSVEDTRQNNELINQEKTYPLFCEGGNRIKFNYGVLLLNRNILQLRHYWLLKTEVFSATLPNLINLINALQSK